ncbi:MAG: ABC transporter ATP-binding protein [Phycisphaerales bacterium]|nr:MAG: ABC transporter ATP-binding protein [Phycisphaerales bacterium]
MSSSSPTPSPPSSSFDTASANGTKHDPSIVAKLRGISKVYYKPDGSVLVEALKGIDLDIPQGQYIAIMGASGSGKSTIMNLLGCLDRPTRGTYLLDGRDVANMPDDELSKVRGKKIGFVFQAFNLISELTIVDNVQVPLFYQGIAKAERNRRAIEKLDLVGLGDRLSHRPKELSGGQQQRVAIARALINDPSIIMADEPTGNLDTKTGTAILKLFDDLHAAGMTIIMVTHDDSVAELCERVVRLRDGEIESDTMIKRKPLAQTADVAD